MVKGSGMRRKNRIAVLVTALAMVIAIPSLVHAQSATLAWDRNAEPEVTGYRVYYGTQSGVYTVIRDVGNVTTFQVTGLDVSLNYYFAVQAYASNGLSSALSNEVPLPAPVPPGTTTISSFAPNATYPLLAGVPVTWTAAASSTRGPVEYKFLKFNATTGWTIVQDFSSVRSYTWTPSWSDLGSHIVQVWVRTVGSTAPYEAWVGTVPFNVNSVPVQITPNVEFPTPPGNPVQWTATVAGTPAGSTLEYKFLILNQATSVWSVVRDYAPSNQATWTPSATGNYVMQVWARRTGSTAAYEVWGGTGTLTVARTTLQVVALGADVTFPVTTGTALKWTARIKGGTQGPVQYQFARLSPTAGWQIVQPYSSSPTYNWTPGWGEEGLYSLQVWVKNSGSAASYDAWRGTSFEIKRAAVQLAMTHTFPVPAGTNVGLAALVSDTSVPLEYAYYVYRQSTGTWSLARAYSTSNTFTWTPPANGTYLVQVWVRRVGSTVDYDVWQGSDYLIVSSSPAKVKWLTPNVTLPSRVGTAITWSAVGTNGTAAPLQYKFLLYREGTGWTILRDYATGSSVVWTPSQTGTYAVQVWVRSAGSTQAYEGWLGTDFFLIQP